MSQRKGILSEGDGSVPSFNTSPIPSILSHADNQIAIKFGKCIHFIPGELLQAMMYIKFQRDWMSGSALQFNKKFSPRNPEKKAS